MRKINIDRKSGIYRFFALIVIVGRGYAMLAIAGLGHINLSSTTGNSVTIRIPGGTATISQWRTYKLTRTTGTTRLERTIVRIPKVRVPAK